MTAMVAFVSTRLDHIYFYVLAGACIVLALVIATSTFRRLARRFPALLGKAIAPRWEIGRRTGKPVVNIQEQRKAKLQKWQPNPANHANAA